MKAAFIASTLGVLGVLNWMILEKEMLIESAQSIYLELAPRDPRSLMQGDYMVLGYVATRAAAARIPPQENSGQLVLRLDPQRIGHFERIENGQPLGPNEIRVRFTRNRQVEIGAESFFFEEGTGDAYSSAKYGELKVAADGSCVLTGLLDGQRRRIEPR